MALSITLSQTGIPSAVADTLQGAKIGAPITVVIPTLGGASYVQELLGKPAGSSATIGAGASATFTPDKIGSYRGRSKRTSGGVTESTIWIVRVQRNALGQVEGLGVVSPAPDEASTEGGTDPYPTRWERNLEALSPRGGTFSSPLVVAGNKQYDLSATAPAIIALASSGHENGATATLLIRPYTAPSVSLPAEANVTGPAFDQAYGYRIEIEHFGGVFRTLTSTIKAPDLDAPAILWVHVLYENPRKVEIKLDRPCYVANKDAVIFSSSNVTEVISGEGTDTILLLVDTDIDPTGDTLTIEGGAIVSMWGVSMDDQIIGTHWRILPSEPVLQMTSYRDATVPRPTTAGSIWGPGGEWDDSLNWYNGTHAPGYSANEGIDGGPACLFVASEGDKLTSPQVVSDAVGLTDGALWLVTWPGAWSLGSGHGRHEYPALLASGTACNINMYQPGGTDAEKVDFLSYDTTAPGFESLDVPAVPHQPAVFRYRWHGGTKYGKVNDRAELSVAFAGLPSWSNSQAFGIGGMGDLDRNTDQRWMAFLSAKVDPNDPEIFEGVNSHFMRLPGAGFMRPQPTTQTAFGARVGQALVIPWGQLLLYPFAPGSADYSWLSFSVSGLTGAAVTTQSVTWTPTTAGLFVASVAISLGGKVIRNFTFRIQVVPASSTGTDYVCLTGDSWSDGGDLGYELCKELEAMGRTVVMLGARGGYAATAVDVAANIITVTNPTILNTGDPIEIYDSAGKIPTGLGSAYSTLYAEKVDATPTQIKCRATPTGPAIDITADGWQTFSVNTTTGLITRASHGWVAQPKAFSRWPILRVRANGGTIPTGLSAGIDYYFEEVDANSGYLCLAYNGARVIPSTVGAGAFQIGPAYLYVRTPKQRHEGRGGWSHAHYLEPVGNPVAGPGPFIDPATDLYSWDHFKSQNLGGISPTIWIPQLGINGGLNGGVLGRQKDAMIQRARSVIDVQAQAMISAALNGEPALKVIVPIPALPSCKQSYFTSDYGATYSQWEWSQAAFRIQEGYKFAFANREAERIVLGTLQVYDPGSDYVNSVHPGNHTKGGKQLAYTIARVNP